MEYLPAQRPRLLSGLGEGCPSRGCRGRVLPPVWVVPATLADVAECGATGVVAAGYPQGGYPCPRSLDRSVMRVPDHVRVLSPSAPRPYGQECKSESLILASCV